MIMLWLCYNVGVQYRVVETSPCGGADAETYDMHASRRWGRDLQLWILGGERLRDSDGDRVRRVHGLVLADAVCLDCILVNAMDACSETAFAGGENRIDEIGVELARSPQAEGHFG